MLSIKKRPVSFNLTIPDRVHNGIPIRVDITELRTTKDPKDFSRLYGLSGFLKDLAPDRLRRALSRLDRPSRQAPSFIGRFLL